MTVTISLCRARARLPRLSLLCRSSASSFSTARSTAWPARYISYRKQFSTAFLLASTTALALYSYYTASDDSLKSSWNTVNSEPVSADLEKLAKVKDKPRLVILGSGWGATGILTHLKPDTYDVLVISPTNNFFFTPLLPAATCGTVETRSLVEPTRRICRRAKASYFEGEAEDVQLDTKIVNVKGADGRKFDVEYDILIVAVGSQSNTFGLKGVAENCFFLKSVSDARRIRAHIMNNFEKAALPTCTPEERKKLLSFVICGGGPTGVEVAGELYDFFYDDLKKYFPDLVKNDVKVHIVQSGDHILNTFDAKISDFTERRFHRTGIDVITNARVQEVHPNKIIYRQKHPDGTESNKELDFGFCLWSTGISMRPIVKKINDHIEDQKNKKALEVDDKLKLLGGGNVYAIGDCSTMANPKLVERLMVLFSEADIDRDGRISYDEFVKMAESIKQKYPRTGTMLKKAKHVFEKYDIDKSQTLELEEFKTMLVDIEKTLKTFPATAQVASQQGKYIAEKLNKISEVFRDRPDLQSNRIEIAKLVSQLDEELPGFHYRHLGTMAYVGGENAVADFGEGLAAGGISVAWLWRGAYLSEQVSFRTRVLLAFDFIKKWMFGRDISKY
ncbi:hypothetical protein BKA69DRAFT_1128184 [Paraphysoderma sedebokerense]|nr:hypothetical protein BKA69DRAFT_1128184 [Paraphysoderma sedebokerense]